MKPQRYQHQLLKYFIRLQAFQHAWKQEHMSWKFCQTLWTSSVKCSTQEIQPPHQRCHVQSREVKQVARRCSGIFQTPSKTRESVTKWRRRARRKTGFWDSRQLVTGAGNSPPGSWPSVVESLGAGLLAGRRPGGKKKQTQSNAEKTPFQTAGLDYAVEQWRTV